MPDATELVAERASGSVGKSGEREPNWWARVTRALSGGFGLRLALIGFVGLAVRMTTVLHHYRDLPLGLDDNNWYHTQANLLADHGGIFEPFIALHDGELVASAGHPPGYAGYLGVWSLLGLDSPTAHRLASSVAGAIGVVIVGLLARHLARLTGVGEPRSSHVGLLAALFAALYPNFWINDGLILAESPYVAVVAALLWLTYRSWRSPTTRNLVYLGGAIGVATLLRTEAATFGVFVVIPLIIGLRRLGWRRQVTLLVACALTAAVVVAPWVARNLGEFDEPVLIASGTGRVLAYGSCEAAWSGQFFGYWHASCTLSTFPDGDESVVDLAHREKASDFIEDNLDRAPAVVLARVGRIWGVFRPGQTQDFDVGFERRGVLPNRLGVVAYALLAPLAIGGLVLIKRRGVTIAPLLGVVALVTWTAAITFGVTRYRVAAEVVVVVAAALFVEAVLDMRRRRPVDDREPSA